jgi:hypothetical protein
MRSFLRFSLITAAVILTACGSKKGGDSSSPDTSQSNPGSNPGQSKTLSSVQYFKAGSVDYTVDFTQYISVPANTPAGFPITVKIADPLCSRKGIMQKTDETDLLNLLKSFTMSYSGGIVDATAGDEYIQLNYDDAHVLKVHLQNKNVIKGELYMTNGADFSTILQRIYAGLPPEVCS